MTHLSLAERWSPSSPHGRFFFQLSFLCCFHKVVIKVEQLRSPSLSPLFQRQRPPPSSTVTKCLYGLSKAWMLRNTCSIPTWHEESDEKLKLSENLFFVRFLRRCWQNDPVWELLAATQLSVRTCYFDRIGIQTFSLTKTPLCKYLWYFPTLYHW